MDKLEKEIEELKKQMTQNAEVMETRFQLINDRLGSSKTLVFLMGAGLFSGYLIGRFSKSRRLAFSLIKNQIIVKKAIGFIGKDRLLSENPDKTS